MSCLCSNSKFPFCSCLQDNGGIPYGGGGCGGGGGGGGGMHAHIVRGKDLGT